VILFIQINKRWKIAIFLEKIHYLRKFSKFSLKGFRGRWLRIWLQNSKFNMANQVMKSDFIWMKILVSFWNRWLQIWSRKSKIANSRIAISDLTKIKLDQITFCKSIYFEFRKSEFRFIISQNQSQKLPDNKFQLNPT